MKHPILLLLLLIVAGTASAGPNQGVVLAVHGDQEGIATAGDGPLTLPSSTDDLVPRAEPDPHGVEWFTILAVSPPENSPDIFVVTFGLGDYDPDVCEVAYSWPAHAGYYTLEIPTDNWPGPFSGTSVAFGEVGALTNHIEPIYYIGVYARRPGEIPLGDFYPSQDAVVVTYPRDGMPVEDPIAGFAVLGCGGAEGENVLPWVYDASDEGTGDDSGGAAEDGTGDSSGNDSDDGSNGPSPAARETSTWGAIKAIYR